MDILVGTYSSSDDDSVAVSKGIYAVSFDPDSGEFGHPRLVASCLNPSYLLLDRDGQMLFAVREVFKDDAPALSSFQVVSSSDLTAVSDIAISGELPCHLAFDPIHGRLASAQYWTGDIALCDVKEGVLQTPTSIPNLLATGPKTTRQDGPHAHYVAFSNEGEVLHVIDLGTDSLTSHRLSPENIPIESTVLRLPAGCGPRHMAINHANTRAFLFCELDESLIVLGRSGLGWEIEDVLSGFTAPEDGLGGGAAIRISGDERHVYISGRRQSRITGFAVDAKMAPLGEFDTGGDSPRDFIITKDGGWLIAAHQESGTLTSLQRDKNTGLLAATGHDCRIGQPVSLVELS